MALFVLIVVGVVVAQTWIDFRDTSKNRGLPDWAKGTALAGVVAVSLTAVSSFASYWLQSAGDSGSQTFMPRQFWPEAVFLVCVMGIIVITMRKKRLRLMLLLTALATAGFVCSMWFA